MRVYYGFPLIQTSGSYSVRVECCKRYALGVPFPATVTGVTEEDRTPEQVTSSQRGPTSQGESSYPRIIGLPVQPSHILLS